MIISEIFDDNDDECIYYTGWPNTKSIFLLLYFFFVMNMMMMMNLYNFKTNKKYFIFVGFYEFSNDFLFNIFIFKNFFILIKIFI